MGIYERLNQWDAYFVSEEWNYIKMIAYIIAVIAFIVVSIKGYIETRLVSKAIEGAEIKFDRETDTLLTK